MLQRLTLGLFGYIFFNAETDVQAFDFSYFYLNYLRSFVFAKINNYSLQYFSTKQKKEQNIINVNFHSFKGYNSVK